MAYITINDLKAEGLADNADESRTNRLINLACAWFDKVTGQWFESRDFTEDAPLLLDGSGKATLHLPVPIIEITKVIVDDEEVDPDDYVIYNRRSPDDRGNPKIVMVDGVWASGRLNVALVGTFGYCDFVMAGEPAELTPVTPELVKQVLMKLVMREMPQVMTSAGQTERRMSTVTSETTDGHSYTLEKLAASGGLTGDPDIDNVVALYTPTFCAVL